jgi:hypothetical protein
VEEQENILDMVQRSPTTSMRRLSTRLCVHEHVYCEHCMKTACTHFTHSVCKIYTQRRNSRRWSHDNPHGTLETKFQRRFSSVWCGMIDDMLIGPVILGDRMIGQNYLDFMQYGLPKQLEDVPVVIRIAMYIAAAIRCKCGKVRSI